MTFDKDGVKMRYTTGRIIVTGSLVKDISMLSYSEGTCDVCCRYVGTVNKRIKHLNANSMKLLENGLVSEVHYNETASEKWKVCL